MVSREISCGNDFQVLALLRYGRGGSFVWDCRESNMNLSRCMGWQRIANERYLKGGGVELDITQRVNQPATQLWTYMGIEG